MKTYQICCKKFYSNRACPTFEKSKLIVRIECQTLDSGVFIVSFFFRLSGEDNLMKILGNMIMYIKVNKREEGRKVLTSVDSVKLT